jgi:hypothetical protein
MAKFSAVIQGSYILSLALSWTAPDTSTSSKSY